jgi:DNA-directed RNA polymerase subunit M/transcription elongation factor TFIIS
MPIVPLVYVGRRVTAEKQGRARRVYACASCGYRAEIEVTGAARAEANGSIVAPRDQIETEARERADAALADEMQDLFDLIPCPKCRGRSENAGLYRQNTVLAVIGCLLAGAAMSAYAYLATPANRTGLESPLVALLGSMVMGIALASVCWHRRNARILRVASAVRFFPAEEDAPAPRRRQAM